MTQHAKSHAYAGSGGPCGDGYHFTQYGCCTCGWQVAIDWTSNTCTCTPQPHTADGLLEAERLANRLLNRHLRATRRQADGQQELL